MDHLNCPAGKLEFLHQLGIRVDHFGAGSGSISILENLPVKRTKIDQSFIKEIHTDSKYEQIAARSYPWAAGFH